MFGKAGSDDAGGRTVNGIRSQSKEKIFECAIDGPKLTRLQDALDLIGEARAAGATLVVLPVERLDSAFFELKSGLAGEMVQKFITYQLRLAIVGDTQAAQSESKSLRDFIREANRGQSVWFVERREELDALLDGQGAGNR